MYCILYINNFLKKLGNESKGVILKIYDDKFKSFEIIFFFFFHFNTHFIDVVNELTSFTSITYSSGILTPSVQRFYFEIPFYNSIDILLSKLSKNNGSQYSLSPYILQKFLPVFFTHIHCLISKFIVYNIFPNSLKEAKVLLLFRTGDRLDVAN